MAVKLFLRRSMHIQNSPRPTIIDVARLSGVSKSTVSNVILNAPVSDQTRTKVLAAIKELGYRPNALARDLKRRRTATVGVMVGDLANPFFGELTTQVEQRMTQAGYATIICDADGSRARERENMELLLEQRVSAVLMMFFSGDSTTIEKAERVGVPIVGLSLLDRRFDCVASDDAKGSRLAVRHLAQLGHERIAYVPQQASEPSMNARLRGWRQALKQLDLLPGPLVALFPSSLRSRFKPLEDVLGGPESPTAYMAANDVTALYLIHRLEAAGVAVPGDASVVGFDDIALVSLRRLALTTVRQPIAELAERGAARVLETIQTGDLRAPGRLQERLPVELIKRRTTAAPRRHLETA
ncbi:MAG: LacI family DNA-binding transcriptional regulator [Solirubrobacteraceae bacterium]